MAACADATVLAPKSQGAIVTQIHWSPLSASDLGLQIGEDASLGRAVLLLGAAVSSLLPSRLPLGYELRDVLVQSAIDASPIRGAYRRLTSDQRYQQLVPEVVFSDLFTTIETKLHAGFQILRYATHNTLHATFARWSREYGLKSFTTNFDMLLEKAGAAAELVFHVHGSIEQPARMAILLRHVHQGAEPDFRDEFLAATKGRRLYVLGYSGSDADILRMVAESSASEVVWLVRSRSSPAIENLTRLTRPVTVATGDLAALYEPGPACARADQSLELSRARVLSDFRASLNLAERHLAAALLLYRAHEYPYSGRLLASMLRRRSNMTRKERLRVVVFRAEVQAARGAPGPRILKLLAAEAEEPATTVVYGQLLNTVGRIHLEHGAYEVARQYLLKAQERARWHARIGPEHERALARTLLSQTFNNLGLCAYGSEDFASAEKYFKESLRLKRRIGHSLGEAASQQNLALVACRTGRWGTFKRREAKALKQLERYRLWRWLATHYRDTADLFAKSGDKAEARARFGKAITVLSEHTTGMTKPIAALKKQMLRLE